MSVGREATRRVNCGSFKILRRGEGERGDAGERENGLATDLREGQLSA